MTFFTSIKHVPLTVISSIEYIYVQFKYIKSKSNTQNCQVENNMKMIFAMEKFKSLVVMLSKLHDHGKATSTRTKLKGVLAFFVWSFPSFYLQKSTLSKMTSACNTEKNQLVIFFFFLAGLSI